MEPINDPKAELRRLAEEKWHQYALKVKEFEKHDPKRLIHELEVHQIELEMQNEELILTKQELEESREKYFDLYNLAPVGYLTLTESGIICLANLTASKLLGIERNLLENKVFVRFVSDEDQKTYHSKHDILITSGIKQQFDIRLKRYDNKLFWAQLISVISWKKDGSFENRLMITDISEQKQAEEQKNIFLQAIRHSADCMAITDKDFRFIFVNDSFCKTYGYSEKELIGKSFDRVHSKNNSNEIIAGLFSSLSEKGTWKGEVINTRKDGSEFPVSLAISQISDEKGEMLASIGISRDISELRKAEEIMKETNAKLVKLNAEKDKFFSIIAHDLRSPFTGILGISELLADPKSELTTEEIVTLSASMNRSAENLYKLLNNLLDWAMLQKGSLGYMPHEFSLSKLLSENIEKMEQRAIQKGIRIESEIPENQLIFADENMINSVIRNLLSNAVKFTRSDGRIIVRSKTNNNDTVEVSVHDTGIGISHADIDRLFRIDEKVSSSGTNGEPSTGLGLLLAKEFITKHDGRIWVESELGKGSTFSICLPVKAQGPF